MRRVKDKRTDRKTVVFEAGDGIRRRYHMMLDPSRGLYPRNVKLKRDIAYYLGDKPLERPLFAIYGLARLAEYFLWHTKFGPRARGRGEIECVRFFAATRRLMQNVLSSFPVGREVGPRSVLLLRKRAKDLQDYGRHAWNSLKIREDSHLTPSTER